MLILTRLGQHSGTALLKDGGRLSYRELEDWSDKVAASLAGAGAGREATIGLLAPSGFEYFAGLLAIWKAGAIAVPLQPAHPLEELKYIVQDSGLATILTAPALVGLGRSLAGDNVSLWPIKPVSAYENASRTEVSAQAQDGALMIYTSGTTGKPKGVVTTRANLDAQISALLEAWGWSEEDRTLNVLPLHHIHGVVVLGCCALAAGAAMELSEKFSPELVWERMAAREINVFMAVPTIYAKLVQHFERQTPQVQKAWSDGAGSLRLAVSGSAALPVPLFETWKKISGQPLLERYGMTEIGIALSNPYRGERKAGSVGKPLPGVEVRLSSEGELEIRGKTVFREYWGKPQATQDSFTPDGWFKTGDIAELDSSGAYRILGRNSVDIIKTGGYKVSALEIENCLLEHPGVRECAVGAVADGVWGERVAAAWAGEATAAELEDFLKQKLARYKVPTVWKCVEALPRNAMGKVLKKQLQDVFN